MTTLQQMYPYIYLYIVLYGLYDNAQSLKMQTVSWQLCYSFWGYNQLDKTKILLNFEDYCLTKWTTTVDRLNENITSCMYRRDEYFIWVFFLLEEAMRFGGIPKARGKGGRKQISIVKVNVLLEFSLLKLSLRDQINPPPPFGISKLIKIFKL